MKKFFLILTLVFVISKPIEGRYIIPNLRNLRKIEMQHEQTSVQEVEQKVIQKILRFTKMVKMLQSHFKF